MKKRTPIAVILTDTHLEDDNVEANKRVFAEARRIAKESDLGVVYHSGDIFDSRKAQTQHILSVFDDILDEHDGDQIDLDAVPGNHDKTDYSSRRSFLDPFRHHRRFNLYRGPVDRILPKGFVLTLMPFFDDPTYIKLLQEHYKDRNIFESSDIGGPKQIMLTHIGLDQAMMNNGIKVSSQVKDELFSAYDKVYIGHYHDASDYNTRIRYIGSSLQHTFGERADKGITVLYSDLTTDAVDPGTPKFYTYIVPVENLTNKRLAEIKKVKEEGQDNIRVVITGDEAKVKAFDKNRLQVAGIKVATKEEKIIKDDIDERVEAFTDSSISMAFASFCEKNTLNLKEGQRYLNSVIPQQIEECTDQTTS